jgi:hypothetical protein
MKRSRIQFSDEFDGDGAPLFKACAEQGLEGIVSKHSLAPYRSGRSKTWLKTKCWTDLDLQKLRLAHRLTAVSAVCRLYPVSERGCDAGAFSSVTTLATVPVSN